MDGNSFDALARRLSSRRTAIGALMAGVVLRPWDAVASKGKVNQRKHKKHGRGKSKSRGKGKDKGKKNGASAQAEQCWRTGACIPKKGANVSRCDLAGYAPTSTLDCTGCNISRANLRGANLSGANLTRANLSGSCLIDANLSGATIVNNTNLANAVFCNTTMPDGSINNSGCQGGTTCCSPCEPTTCSALGKSCGAWPDGCGGALSCGTCASGSLCDNGTCQTCDVTCSGTPEACGAALQAALSAPGPDGAVYVCPGTYRGGFTLTSRVQTVIGAGQGGDPAIDTILHGNREQKVIASVSEDTALRQVRITGGLAQQAGGSAIDAQGNLLKVTDCTVIDNHTVADFSGPVAGAIYVESGDRLEMTRCTIRDNTVTNVRDNGRATGAGLFVLGNLVMTDCVIRNNSCIADRAQAAGVWVLSGSATLTGCRVTENTLTQPDRGTAGGIVTSILPAAPVTLVDSYVWNNTAPDCYGPITGSGCGTAPPA